MRLLKMILLVPIGFGLAACATSGSGSAGQHEVGCVASTLTGAVIGGAIGNQFGGGRGNALLTGVGAVAGGASAANSSNCARF